MRLENLRQADLNLLITFAAIAEERSVTAAASRLRLSQPAVSRALQRARSLFQDDLLVRAPNGFELTLRGRRILDELGGLLPLVEQLIKPNIFDPLREGSHFRVSGPDNVCTVLLPELCRKYAGGKYQVSFEFLPWQSDITDLLEHGQLDIALQVDDVLLPAHLHSEKLYREEWICVVAHESSVGRQLSLQQYLAADHLVVSSLPGVQTIPDKRISALGQTRSSSLRIPYFGAALQCLPGTELVLTTTSGMRPLVDRDQRLRIAKAPKELHPFYFLMAWHPRMQSDPRHRWLRDALHSIASSKNSDRKSSGTAQDI